MKKFEITNQNLLETAEKFNLTYGDVYSPADPESGADSNIYHGTRLEALSPSGYWEMCAKAFSRENDATAQQVASSLLWEGKPMPL